MVPAACLLYKTAERRNGAGGGPAVIKIIVGYRALRFCVGPFGDRYVFTIYRQRYAGIIEGYKICPPGVIQFPDIAVIFAAQPY